MTIDMLVVNIVSCILVAYFLLQEYLKKRDSFPRSVRRDYCNLISNSMVFTMLLAKLQIVLRDQMTVERLNYSYQ